MRNAPPTTTSPGGSAAAVDELDVLLLDGDDDGADAIISAIARDAPGWTVARERELTDALTKLRTDPPDIIVADLEFAGASAIDIVDRVIGHDPMFALVIVHGRDDDHVALDVIRRGAEDCLAKVDLDGASLVRAMRHAVARARQHAGTARHEVDAEISFESRLLELAGQSIVATDPDGVVLYWNPAATDLYGWQPEEVMGNPVADLVHPSGTPALMAEIGAVLGRGETWTGELTVQHQDGSVFSVLVSNTPMFDDRGKLVAVVGLSADISARKAAEAASGLLSAIVEGSHDAIIGSTLDGIVTSWNPAAAALFGFSPDEAVGRHVSLITAPDRVEEVHANIARVTEGGVVSVETVRRRKDGTSVEVWLTVSPVRDGDGTIVGSSAIIRDKTDLVTQERAAAEQRRLLAESNGIAELHAARRQAAEQANEAKNQFLSRMSHELRTPLNAVIGFSQLLQRQQLSPEDDDAVTQIHRAGRHLLDLINEVLDVSRVEAGGLHLSADSVDLAEVCGVAVDLIDPARRTHGITIAVSQIDPSIAVRADRQRVLQIVLELLANAVKYNKAGGRVDITTELVDLGTVRLAITDTGPGIARKDLARVFVPFERLGAERTDVEGTGMGLALCRSLAQEMGGTMGVESTPGCGSTFWVDLPHAQDEPTRRPPGELVLEPAGDAPLTRRSVLYIEDNLPSRRLVQRALEDHGTATVISAEEGLQGFEMAKRLGPSVILLDLHLPDISGAHVLALLRAEASTEHIPVVIVSADATAAQRERLLHIGATDYLTKPVDLTALAQVVDRLLGSATG